MPEKPRDLELRRKRMVEEQLVRRGIQSASVLAAMREVPREAFVPEHERDKAWDDCALPLAHGQTISQPYMVARNVELAELRPSDTVLEVGLGSGYQAAVMSRLCARVVGIELLAPLAETAEQTLRALGYDNVLVRVGDGSVGLPELAPYDRIVVAAGALHVPEQLVHQLKVGGRLLIPVGTAVQTLTVVTRTGAGSVKKEFDQCMYVPLRGAAGQA
ncbi:MAG TPA: protein-L-isoaspartate(D-aspartate) O-methyltransferase [Polyangiales bacterium]|nr:protein-L-isoaspartate(D-aspartate) O-methyltransferase [Polyangiales bacterium]